MAASEADQWAGAIFAYNHLDAYVRSVLDAADSYATRANGG